MKSFINVLSINFFYLFIFFKQTLNSWGGKHNEKKDLPGSFLFSGGVVLYLRTFCPNLDLIEHAAISNWRYPQEIKKVFNLCWNCQKVLTMLMLTAAPMSHTHIYGFAADATQHRYFACPKGDNLLFIAALQHAHTYMHACRRTNLWRQGSGRLAEECGVGCWP